jgi:predicted dehydrogenase
MHASAAAVALGAVPRARADDPVRPIQQPAPRRATPRDGKLRLGLIGCGGRGTGAAIDFLTAAPEAGLVALADVFPDRLEGSRAHLLEQGAGLSSRVDVPGERCFTGFDAYERLLRLDVDVVILATPPGFRPLHLDAAVKAGKHCFIEKPVAVDPAGVRSVIASSAEAERRGLCIVAGTQRRHQRCYLEAMERIHGGAIGRIVGGSCYWNQGGLWMNPRQPAWSDTEWQLRNWLYFTWLSGDHIVEQHVHNIDVMNWAIGATPTRVSGSGGRQVRTDPAYGHIFDHFAVELEYPGGVSVTSMCRQIEGCESRVEEVIVGTEGRAVLSHGRARIEGKSGWKYEGPDVNPYEQEHRDLVAAITSGSTINEGRRIAESTLTAIMGRMAAYTGKPVAWEKALVSTLDLMPRQLDLGPLPAGEVAVPGRTPLV